MKLSVSSVTQHFPTTKKIERRYCFSVATAYRVGPTLSISFSGFVESPLDVAFFGKGIEDFFHAADSFGKCFHSFGFDSSVILERGTPSVRENSLLWTRGNRSQKVIGDHLIEVRCCVFSFADRMRAIWIGKHRELLIVLDQLID